MINMLVIFEFPSEFTPEFRVKQEHKFEIIDFYTLKATGLRFYDRPEDEIKLILLENGRLEGTTKGGDDFLLMKLR